MLLLCSVTERLFYGGQLLLSLFTIFYYHSEGRKTQKYDFQIQELYTKNGEKGKLKTSVILSRDVWL